MECRDIREQLPSRATMTLDADMAAAVDMHLTACEDCRRIADEYVTALDELPGAIASASRVRMPAGLKQRVMSAAAASTVAEAPAERASPVPRRDAPRGGTTRGVDLGGAPAPRWRHLIKPRLVAAAVAAVLVVGAISWSGYLSVALGRERNSRQELAELLGMQEIVLEVVDSNRTSRVLLKAQEQGSTAYGKLYTRSDFADVVAMAGRLPDPLPGESYYLWVVTGGETRLAGQMTVNDVGFGLIVFKSDQAGPEFDQAFVTRQTEPPASPAGTRALSWTR